MTDPGTLWPRANALAAARDWPAAAALFEAIATATPGDAAAWIAAAKARGLADQPRAAFVAANAALAAGPATWAHGLARAGLLRAQQAVPELVGLAAMMAERAGEAPVADLVEWADLLGRVDAHAEAMPWLERALARDATHAPAWYLRGTTRLFLGELGAARSDLLQAITLAPHFAHAHWRLSELRARDPAGAAARVDRLRAERERVAPGSEHDIHFSYALHAELHDLGDFPAAWAALARGARAKRAHLDYDPAEDQALFAALQAQADADFLAGPGHEGEGEPVPVFIVGLFRSGTTLLERMLAGHSQLADGGESLGFAASLRRAVDHHPRTLVDRETLRRLAGVDFRALGADFMARSAWRARGRGFWTEKLPSNALLLGLLARALPRARFIHAQRAAMDVCFSNLRTLYGGICPYSYDQAELAAYWHGHSRLMAHWRARLGDRLLDVAHEDLLQAPEAGARRVLAHLGLDYEPGVLDIGGRGGAVSTASAAQVREGLRAPAPPAWRPYENELRPLREALARPG